MKVRVALVLLALAINAACFYTRSVPDDPPMMIPYADHQIFLMDALAGSDDVCLWEHTYANKVVTFCAPLREVRAFLHGHSTAENQ